MRRSKEIIVLAVLLVGMIGFILWYVADRRAKNRATTTVAPQPVGMGPARTTAGPGPLPPPVVVPIQDHKTIDFSSGRPVVKDSPEDRAAMDRAVKEMAAAVKDVTFGPPARKTPAPPEPKKD